MTRILLAIVLMAHGIGHSLGAFPALGLATLEGWTDQSSVVTTLLGDTVARLIGVTLFVTALVAFLGAGLALLGWLVPQTWFRHLAVTAAAVSLAALTLYWSAFPSLSSKLAAIAVDLGVLYVTLWAHWPSDI